MSAIKTAQRRYLIEVTRDVDSSNFDAFDELSESEGAQVVRHSALRRIRERAALTPGIPLRDDVLEAENWADLMVSDIRDSLAEVEPGNGLGQLRESGIPLVESVEVQPLDTTESDLLTAMREVGIPMKSPGPEPRAMTSEAALLSVGIPMREAAPIDDTPHHVLAKNLDAVVDADHPHRELVDGLISKGAALSADDKTTIDGLVSIHGDKLRQDFNDQNDDDQPESASSLSAGEKSTAPASSPTELNSGHPSDHPTASAGSLNQSGTDVLLECNIPLIGIPARSREQVQPEEGQLVGTDLLKELQIPLRRS